MSGGGFEVVSLWKCSYCGWITDGSSPVHGPITSQAYCQGVPVRHPRMKMDRLTVAPVDQVVAALEAEAKRQRQRANDAPTERVADQREAASLAMFRFADNLAANLKQPTGD